mmetsp:Transcript_9094/g.8682  ORF Transcript_9094/g.8682 Transcript_9094/m.8682 type:complete len:137 (-) Transcript_9094:543-953(-)
MSAENMEAETAEETAAEAVEEEWKEEIIAAKEEDTMETEEEICVKVGALNVVEEAIGSVSVATDRNREVRTPQEEAEKAEGEDLTQGAPTAQKGAEEEAEDHQEEATLPEEDIQIEVCQTDLEIEEETVKTQEIEM